jgi:hypothetical protein
MKQFALALVLALSLGLANQASAADMPLKAPPPPVEPVTEICWGCIVFAGAVIACVILCPHHHHHNNPITTGAPQPT